MPEQRVLVVVNAKGAEREMSERSWLLLRSAKEQGQTRKGYTFVRFKAPGEKGVGGSPTKVAVMGPAGPTFIPVQVAEAAAAAAAEATVNSGTMVTKEDVLKASGYSVEAPAQQEAPAPPAPVVPETPAPPAPPKAPAAAAPVADKKGDDFAKVPNMGAKSATALKEAGIVTFADLAGADEEVLTKVLTAGGYAVKVPLIGAWKKAATDLANPTPPAP